MKIKFSICTANHGLNWHNVPHGIEMSKIDHCRTAFGRLPDFDAGESGFEGIAVSVDYVFVARCFKAEKWDFKGRDSLYLAVASIPADAFNDVNVDRLLSLPYFNEPMRDPPTEFELDISSEKNIIPVGINDGLVLRREIGSHQFFCVFGEAQTTRTEVQEASIAEKRPPSTVIENLSVLKRRINFLWILIVLFLAAVIAIFSYDVIRKYEGVEYGRDGDKMLQSGVRTNGVTSRAVSSESSGN